jgi:hypothetical protein
MGRLISQLRAPMQTRFSSITSVTIFALCTILVRGQVSTDPDVAEQAEKLVKAHVNWRTKLSSPGASIRVKEIGRHGSLVQYHLYASGLASNQLYRVSSWPVTQAEPSAIAEGVSLGKDGIVMCAGRRPQECGDPSKKDDPIEFTFSPVKGEPFRLALVSGSDRAAVVMVADPITAKDKACKLSVERLTPRFEVAYILGTGFSANSDLSFESRSYDETHPIKAKTDADGNLQFAILPFVAGHQKGTTVVKGLGTDCSPSIKFDWGN